MFSIVIICSTHNKLLKYKGPPMDIFSFFLTKSRQSPFSRFFDRKTSTILYSYFVTFSFLNFISLIIYFLKKTPRMLKVPPEMKLVYPTSLNPRYHNFLARSNLHMLHQIVKKMIKLMSIVKDLFH